MPITTALAQKVEFKTKRGKKEGGKLFKNQAKKLSDSVCLSGYTYDCVYVINTIHPYLWMVLLKLICKRALFNWFRSECLQIKYFYM